MKDRHFDICAFAYSLFYQNKVFLSECKFELECFELSFFIVVSVDLILSLLVIRSLRLLYLFLSILSLGVAAVSSDNFLF